LRDVRRTKVDPHPDGFEIGAEAFAMLGVTIDDQVRLA